MDKIEINDSGLILGEIQNIFDNIETSLKERFTEYLVYKDNIYERYKLIYDLFAMLLTEEGLEKEIDTLQKLLKAEEEILKKALISAYTTKSGSMNPALPSFFVYASWGMLFSGRLNSIANVNKPLPTREFLMKSLEGFLE